MFVWSFKASTFKLLGIVVISAIALAILIGLVPAISNDTVETGVATLNPKYTFDGIKSESDIVNFATQFNLKLETPESEKVDLKIPGKFDVVLEKYNEIQKRQGFNLEKYKNKAITRYTYNILDETGKPNNKKLSLIVYKEKIIGGDISSMDNGGFVSEFIN